jgi:serine/threonine protein kinase
MRPGTHLGNYEVLSAIGKGGMGEVWRARDKKLQREVAIKALPDEFAKDADRLTRFEREARLLASLNHPNIAAIHGLEEANDTRFLVLELVEGETLADRLKRGPIHLEESLKLSLQVADALEAAHEKGVVHRDLKPANVKVTPEGKVKVLDFGLAKGLGPEMTEPGTSNSPTLSASPSMQGAIHRNARIYVAGAGEGTSRGWSIRHLVVRVSSLRNADGQAGIRGRDGC